MKNYKHHPDKDPFDVQRGRCDEAYVDRSLARLGRLAIHGDEDTDRQRLDLHETAGSR